MEKGRLKGYCFYSINDALTWTQEKNNQSVSLGITYTVNHVKDTTLGFPV
jgi:hypothetical protein